MRKGKMLVAALMVMVMLLSLFPTAVLAESTDSGRPVRAAAETTPDEPSTPGEPTTPGEPEPIVVSNARKAEKYDRKNLNFAL